MNASVQIQAWKVAVVSDGAGSFRAKCTHCKWESQWYDVEKLHNSKHCNRLAVNAAKRHGAQHAQDQERGIEVAKWLIREGGRRPSEAAMEIGTMKPAKLQQLYKNLVAAGKVAQ